MRKAASFLVSGALALAIQFLPATARADLSACGDIHVRAEADCKVIAKGGCDVECQNLSFEAACKAEGYASCKGECSGGVEASCTGSCDIQGCKAACDVDPGEFDCQANCSLDCNADCTGECNANCGTDSDCKAKCKGSCEATCEGECKGSCSGTPPSATCEAKCQASCQGSCKAKSNLECQVDCQADLQASCEARLQGGCTAKCEAPSGAVKCDNQFVDQNGNAQACLDAIRAWADKIDASASGSASCSGNSCKAEGEASASCALGRTGSSSMMGLVAALGLAGVVRRRFKRAG